MAREAGLAFYRNEGRIFRLRVVGRSVALRFIQIGIGAGCVGTRVVALLAIVGMPLVLSAAICYSGALTLAFILAARRAASMAAGAEDIVIDYDRGIIGLPARFGCREPLRIPLNQITEVTWADELEAYDDVSPVDAFGSRKYRRKDLSRAAEATHFDQRSEMKFAVLVCWSDDSGGEHESPAANSYVRERMIALAHLLRRDLGLAKRESKRVEA